ncbi:MAG: DEAD/DEAH box helicase [Planctomycetota bacterium]
MERRSRRRRERADGDGGPPERPEHPEDPTGPAEDPGDPTQRLASWKGFQLLDFQIRAIDAVRSGRNVLVSAPTGAGKTLIAEYAIDDAVRRGRRCVYTSPIKALSNQKYRDFRDDPEIDVGLMTGDVTIHPGAQVLIMTTEILRNAMFEDPRSLHDVDYVIFDEIHYMDDPERGSVWEESMIFAPSDIRFIALSATIANLDELGAWLREIRRHDLAVIRSERRPVPLKHRLFTGGAGIFDGGRLDWARRELRRRATRGRKGRRRGRRPGGKGGRGGRDHDAIGTLFSELHTQDLFPALVFAFSRKQCERLAFQNQHRKLLNPEESERMTALSLELIDLFQLGEQALGGEVFQLASRGVAYHHAGMLPIHKEIVERLFTAGLIKLLFATETFALGINMPARTVVFASLRKFDGVQFDWLRTRDYMQMAGRAGRQGIDDAGLVVSFVDERELEDVPAKRVHSGRPEPVLSRFRLSYSSILHLVEHLGRERLYEAWDKSFNQYQHREHSKKARERNQRRQHRLVDAHLALLEDLGYLEDSDRLTARGRVARLLHGYELQITEMLFRGALENLPPQALAVVFVGLVHEERRHGDPVYVPAKHFGGVRRHITQMLHRLSAQEAEAGIPVPMKLPDWGLTSAVVAWYGGATFEELTELVDAPAGDVCRTFRMSLQLMRQVRRSIDPAWDLGERLEEAAQAINRDEVDARRQLELG